MLGLETSSNLGSAATTSVSLSKSPKIPFQLLTCNPMVLKNISAHDKYPGISHEPLSTYFRIQKFLAEGPSALFHSKVVLSS